MFARSRHFRGSQLEARGKKFGLDCTANIPQYVAIHVPALLTSVSLQTKPMRISLFSLHHKGTKFRAKRSRLFTKAQRVFEGVGKEEEARGGNLRVGGKTRALPDIFTPYNPCGFPLD